MSTEPIAVLTDAARTIRKALPATPAADLQERLTDWYDEHDLIDNGERRDILARYAALHLLLQVTLHDSYTATGDTLGFPPEPPQLPVKGDPLLDTIARRPPAQELSEVLDVRAHLQAADRPAARIGALFEQLIPKAARRPHGQFCTPPHIADLMADWLTTPDADHLLDPGIGAGALTTAASRSDQPGGSADAATFDQLRGIDTSPLARLMSATALSLTDTATPYSLHTGEFTELTPRLIDNSVDAIICNPPYTRHHDIPAATKQRLNDRAEAITGQSVSAHTPLYAYWLYHALDLLAPGGRAAFLTPAEYLTTNYGTTLKEYLATNHDIKALVLCAHGDGSMFRDATTTSLLTLLEQPTDADEPASTRTRFIRIDDWPGSEPLQAALSSTNPRGDPDWGTVTTVPQATLDPSANWQTYFDQTSSRPQIDRSYLRPLGDIATVRRGILTGRNSYFCLPQDDVDDWGIDEQYLSPLVRSPRAIDGYTYHREDWQRHRANGDEVWLLYHLSEFADDPRVTAPPTDSSPAPARTDGAGTAADTSRGVVQYLRHGLAEGVHESHVTRNRDPWFRVDRRDPAPILMTYMSRSGFRAIHNTADARLLNNLHGVYPPSDFDDHDTKALLAYLNSDTAETLLRDRVRTYSGGLDKIEPAALKSMPVLDPRELSDAAVHRLAAAFDSATATDTDETPDSTLESHLLDVL